MPYSPHRFTSKEEYNTYCACMRKLRIGDRVSLWLTDVNLITALRSSRAKDSVPIDIIAIRPNPYRDCPFPPALVGTRTTNMYDKDYIPTLWNLWTPSIWVEQYPGIVVSRDFHKYERCYWINDTDARVSKIYRESGLVR